MLPRQGRAKGVIDGPGPPALRAFDLLYSCFMGHRGPVRARRREGVVDVYDPHDLRRYRDLIAAQPVGIARAVIALVVPADDRLQVPREFDRSEQLEAPDRVHLHDFELLARQRRSEEHTSELQSHSDLVCRLLLEKKKYNRKNHTA